MGPRELVDYMGVGRSVLDMFIGRHALRRAQGLVPGAKHCKRCSKRQRGGLVGAEGRACEQATQSLTDGRASRTSTPPNCKQQIRIANAEQMVLGIPLQFVGEMSLVGNFRYVVAGIRKVRRIISAHPRNARL
jgi:hypothetical protein